MTRKVLLLGTSHVGSFRRVAQAIDCVDFVFDFAAFGVPVWRLMLNRSELIVREDSLIFDIFDSSELLKAIEHADPRFELVCQRVQGVVKDPSIANKLSNYCAIIFVDCLFRYPPGLSFLNGDDGGYFLSLYGQPVTFDLLSELPNVAGAVTSFTEPFLTKNLPFRTRKLTSFVNLFRALHDALGCSVPLFLWTFPGFAEQFPSDLVETSTDRDLMACVHRHALRRNNIPLHYLQPPSELLDPISGRVLPQYIGPGFHANDAFATIALQSILQVLRGVLS